MLGFSWDTKQGQRTSPPNEYTALHQQGNRVGMPGGLNTIFCEVQETLQYRGEKVESDIQM